MRQIKQERKNIRMPLPSILKRISFFCAGIFWAGSTFAQQYNSDSWISKPHGMITIIPTIGQRNTMIMTTYSLIPKWEFTCALYAYNSDGDSRTDDGHSASLYAKYMFYQNKSETGGAAVKFGTGMFPGTIDAENRTDDAFRTFWMNVPVTIPFLNNHLSWDIMPGATVSRNYGTDQSTAWGFTYSTRLAWYPFDYKWALVGEIFGTEGEVNAIPEYKIGVRWEPSQYITYAMTYGQEFTDNNGAGFEFGIMIFTPPFLKISRPHLPWEKRPKKETANPASK